MTDNSKPGRRLSSYGWRGSSVVGLAVGGFFLRKTSSARRRNSTKPMAPMGIVMARNTVAATAAAKAEHPGPFQPAAC